MTDAPYQARFGAIHRDDVGPGFLFTVSPPDLAEEVAATLNALVADRDALLAAIGFKPGPLGDGGRRKVILDDAAGLRPAMVEARRAQAEVEDDATLWQMFILESEHGHGSGGLLAKVWRRAKAAERELAKLKAGR